MNKGLPENLRIECADMFYDSIKQLPDTLKRKLSLAELHILYETSVEPSLYKVYAQATCREVV